MTDIVAAAVEKLRAKLDGRAFDGCAHFVIRGEGALTIGKDGVAAGELGAADVVLTADTETFVRILGGKLGPMQAYMSGKLSIDGDISAAMRLGKSLA